MNTALKIQVSALLMSLAVSTTATADSHDPFADVVVKSTRVADGIYMLTGSGGNIGLSVGDDGVFLIDDQFAPLTERILTEIRKVTDKPVRFVLNTHWHPDHTGGNENLGKAGTVIVSHHNVRKRLTVDNFIKSFNMQSKATKPVGLPVITFNDEMTFHLNGDEVAIRHVAHAHTDGDSFVHFRKANVIHMGDTGFSGMYPFIDTSSGGSVKGYLDAVAKIISLADDKTVIIPGHGPILDKKKLVAWHEMLTDITDKVRDGIKQGKSLEDIKSDWLTADYDDDYSGGNISGEKFVETAYEDLSQGAP